MSGEHAPQRTRSPGALDRNPGTPASEAGGRESGAPDPTGPFVPPELQPYTGIQPYAGTEPHGGGALPGGEVAARIRLEPPSDDDGRELWRVARDTQVLDLNSPYSYLLWCRDFADTSVVARDAGRVCGFITGFIRPRSAATLFVWQVAVDRSHRGQGLARRMLDHLGDRVAHEGRRYLEATVTPDNIPSSRLFESFARGRGCGLERRTLFTAEQFPGGETHQPEVLYRIGPL